MKIKLTLVLIIIFGIVITGCKQNEEKVEVQEVKVDLLNDEFPDAKKEIKLTMDSIAKSVQDADIDKLISFHAYGPKFTEFKNGEVRNNGEENEKFERGVFGSVTEILKFDMNDMKIAVYGKVANVTLHTDFHLKFGEDLAIVNDQMTLLFLKTKNGWRIVHEHHSPLKKTEE
ncbi:nuclear transport factor 2 family protein [Tamlana sp. 2201CG12-4]|uniref:nuclear transport factor 2 family protein n=1 Tax=Tamlana sp. 2201CG12-4 TaxID=3112582 RepID=UPI002DBBA4FE|nr:nuclear transport factor 2 family protein [Tamlana sp. 2201CG12-4]MEC3906130.1 nuclear transport factor 2 family protein [Tamlana sp. 2201CG12-4]